MNMDKSTNTIQSINWGGESFPSYQGFMNSPAITPAGGDGGGGAAAGSGTGSGAAASGSPAAGSTSASPGTTGGGNGGSPTPAGNGQAAAAAIDWATAPAHFRSEYERLKGDHERFSGLGDFETVKSHASFVQSIVSEAYATGEKLGYTEQQIQSALQDDAIHTVQFLRGLAQKQGGRANANGQGGDQSQGGRKNPDGTDIEGLVKKHLAPIESHINNQMTEAANGRFSQEFNRLYTTNFPDHADIPPKFRELLFNATSEMMKYDTEGLSAMKFKGQVAAVAKHFTQVRAAIEEAFTEFAQYQTKKAGGAGRPNVAGGGNQDGANKGLNGLTLDDVIFGDQKAVDAIPSMRPGR